MGERTGATGGSGHSPDPDELVAEIQATREDLAETVDAIFDKVSPKRVAKRSKEQVSESVRQGAVQAREFVNEKAAAAREVVAERSAAAKEAAGAAKEAVAERTGAAQQAVADKTGAAKQAVADRTSAARDAVAGGDAVLPVAGEPQAGVDLPPASGVEVPVLAPDRPTAPTAPLSPATTGRTPGGESTYVSGTAGGLRPEVLYGALAALVGLYLLYRRRR